jgi:hypothetical protein
MSAHDGALLIAEMAYHTTDSSNPGGPSVQKLAIGYWIYSKSIAAATTSTAEAESLSSQDGSKAKSHGLYILAEQSLTSHTA